MNDKHKAGIKLLLMSLPFTLPATIVLWVVLFLVFSGSAGWATLALLIGWSLAIAFVLMV